MLNDFEVFQELMSACIGILWWHGMACRISTRQSLQCGGKARVNSGECATIGFVHAVFVSVG